MAVAAPLQDATKRNYRYEYVRVADLKIDPAYHVPERFKEARAKRYAAHFDEARLGVIEVSSRDEQLWLIDGNHRRYAAAANGIEYLFAKVWMGLSVQEEASIFIGLSDQVPLNGLDLWIARRVDKDPAVLGVEAILEKYGARVVRGGTAAGTPWGTRAATSLERIYNNDPALLDYVVGLVRRIWPEEHKALDGVVVKAIAAFVHAYSKTLPAMSKKRLEDRLSVVGPLEIYRSYGDVRMLTVTRSGSGGHSNTSSTMGSLSAWSMERRAVLYVYNHGLRNKLPDLTSKDLRAINEGQIVDIRENVP